MTRRNILLGLFAMVATVALPVLAAPLSGLKVGDTVTPFHPKHLAGPLAGTSNCFPCTYGDRPQVQVWVNGDDKANVVAITKTLAAEMKEHQKQDFKALVVVLSDPAKMSASEAMVNDIAKVPGTSGVAMAVLPKNHEAIGNYAVNTKADVKNTVFVYKKLVVANKFVNLNSADAGKLSAAIDGITR